MFTTKYTLQLDRLTLSLSLNTPETFNFRYISKHCPFYGNSYTLAAGLELRKSAKRIDKYYLHSFALWAAGEHVGTLHTDSRLAQAEKLVKFEVAQPVLYTRPGFLHYLAQLAAVGLHVEAVSYGEIAFDVQLQKPLLPRLSHMTLNSTLDSYNPRPRYRPLRAKTVCAKLANGAEYTFGHGAQKANGTGKQIAVYSKSDELAQADGAKAYITAFHEANGLDISKPVERVEARINSRWFADNKLAIDAHDLAQLDTLKTLFIRAVGDCFKFVPVEALAKPKRNTQGNYTPPVTDLLPLAFLQSQPVELVKRWAVGESSEVSDSRKRVACRVLVDAYIATGTPEALAALQQFLSTHPAPKRSAWPHLVERYAQGFEGRPTPENKARIADIGRVLTPYYQVW